MQRNALIVTALRLSIVAIMHTLDLDLLAAAESSTDFWDNPEDDEDWNDV